MKCRRCYRDYDPSEAKHHIDNLKSKYRADNPEAYMPELDGLCPLCATIVILGYDRDDYTPEEYAAGQEDRPVCCRACGGDYPDCRDRCPLADDQGDIEERTWYYFKATNPAELDICLRMLHAEGIKNDIVLLPDKNKKLVYRIYPKTDAAAYLKLYERYKILAS